MLFNVSIIIPTYNLCGSSVNADTYKDNWKCCELKLLNYITPIVAWTSELQFAGDLLWLVTGGTKKDGAFFQDWWHTSNPTTSIEPAQDWSCASAIQAEDPTVWHSLSMPRWGMVHLWWCHRHLLRPYIRHFAPGCNFFPRCRMFGGRYVSCVKLLVFLLRTEAMYLAVKETPDLKTVRATLKNGLQDVRLLSSRMPSDAAMCLDWLPVSSFFSWQAAVKAVLSSLIPDHYTSFF